ncbi:hypothetical protein BDB01DRAFT_779077 [Pilobolus umbonatus]|nr:hypothetical protein BDB01DRAFT_779077 [Pilobolus umbonatus]
MSVPSSHNEPSKKRERSSSLTINSAVKKSKIDDIFNSPVKEDDVSKLRICDDIVALWTHSTKGMHSPTGEYSDYEEEDEYDMGDTIFDRHSLRDKPSRRSLLSELLSSSDVAQADTYIYKKRKSALVHSSLFGIDEEDEDEKTTIPKPTEYDEVDAFFSQYTPIEEEKSEINTYNRLGFISPGPHFLTEEYFNTHGPNEKMIPPHNITTTPFLDTDFSIMGRIDSGHYAEVYKARDLSTHQLCAIKKSKLPFKSWDDRWLQLIEVSNMRYIKDSKHCLKMFNAWEEEGYLHIQLELCSTGR